MEEEEEDAETPTKTADWREAGMFSKWNCWDHVTSHISSHDGLQYWDTNIWSF